MPITPSKWIKVTVPLDKAFRAINDELDFLSGCPDKDWVDYSKAIEDNVQSLFSVQTNRAQLGEKLPEITLKFRVTNRPKLQINEAIFDSCKALFATVTLSNAQIAQKAYTEIRLQLIAKTTRLTTYIKHQRGRLWFLHNGFTDHSFHTCDFTIVKEIPTRMDAANTRFAYSIKKLEKIAKIDFNNNKELLAIPVNQKSKYKVGIILDPIFLKIALKPTSNTKQEATFEEVMEHITKTFGNVTLHSRFLL